MAEKKEETLHEKLLRERDYYLGKTDTDPETGKTVDQLKSEHQEANAKMHKAEDERKVAAQERGSAQPKPYDWRQDELPSHPSNRKAEAKPQGQTNTPPPIPPATTGSEAPPANP